MRVFPLVFSAVLVSAGALAFAIGGGGSGGRSEAANTEPPPAPVSTAFAGVLLRVGLGAEALAAAGLSDQEVTAVAGAVESAHSPATLQERDAAFIGAKRTHDTLLRKVQGGKSNQEDVTALRAAETALTNATNGRANYLADLRAAGLLSLSASKKAALDRIQANKAWALPTQYLVKDRSEADWVAMRDALATKRIFEENEDQEFPEVMQSYLAAIDAVSEIATAKVNLDSRIASVQTAWNAAAAE